MYLGIGLLIAQRGLDTINGRCVYVPSESGACFAIHIPNAIGKSTEVFFSVLIEEEEKRPRDKTRGKAEQLQTQNSSVPTPHSPPHKTLYLKKPAQHHRSSSDPRGINPVLSNSSPRTREVVPQDHNTSDVPFFRDLSPRIHVKTAKILVVDDAQSVRTLFQALFKRQGIESVDLAENGQEGLTKLIQNDYDVVFMDFLMPVMNGIDCTTSYRLWEAVNRQKKAVIVGMSANALDTDIKTIEMHMQGFLQKPASFGLVTKFVQFHDYLRDDTRLKVVVPDHFFPLDNSTTAGFLQCSAPPNTQQTKQTLSFLIVTILVAFLCVQFFPIINQCTFPNLFVWLT